MHADYKLSQTDLHEFEIREKPGGALRATIARTPEGSGWTTRLHGEPADGTADAPFEEQKSAQAAFDAFIDRTEGDADDEPVAATE